MRLYLPIIDNGGGNVKAGYAWSCMTSFSGIELHAQRIADSLAPRARNTAAAAFLKSDCDYLLFIDADIHFNAEHIANILEGDEPIVCGVYFLKDETGERKPCLVHIKGDEGRMLEGRVKVARSGTGFMRIHRSVFEKMIESGIAPAYGNHGSQQHDFFQVGVRNGEYLSEDWTFCDNARALGIDVLIDTRVVLWHEGTALFPLSGQDLLGLGKPSGKRLPGS